MPESKENDKSFCLPLTASLLAIGCSAMTDLDVKNIVDSSNLKKEAKSDGDAGSSKKSSAGFAVEDLSAEETQRILERARLTLGDNYLPFVATDRGWKRRSIRGLLAAEGSLKSHRSGRLR